MWENTARVPVYENVDRAFFENEILPKHRPAILKGFVKQWPVVATASMSSNDVCNYLKKYANTKPIKAWYGAPEMKGRFCYNDDCKTSNFEKKELNFSELCEQILSVQNNSQPPCWYASAIHLPGYMPELVQECPMELLDPSLRKLTSLWIGNYTRTAAHWDSPQNLACVIAGRRRFTLFPTSQLPNLYIGPLDNTLAGQPISLVDFHNPDFERFPRFREAIQHAEIADLDAGDVLYLPGMWLHHVESLESFGALINFWWHDSPSYLSTPHYTLMHALLTLRELPEHERMAWRDLFDHYIFNYQVDNVAHIPENARGILGPMTNENYQKIKKILVQTLSR